MRVVLLALSGDSARGHEKLTQHYPQATIETISRAQFETGSFAKRLAVLRAHRPEIFAIVTERLAWQRGQDLFMLFGALAGAREVIMIDSHDGFVSKGRGSLLAATPLRLSREAITSGLDFAESRRELRRLERAVPTLNTRAHRRARDTGAPRVVYLRATPGPGMQAGGAASHIKGV